MKMERFARVAHGKNLNNEDVWSVWTDYGFLLHGSLLKTNQEMNTMRINAAHESAVKARVEALSDQLAEKKAVAP